MKNTTSALFLAIASAYSLFAIPGYAAENAPAPLQIREASGIVKSQWRDSLIIAADGDHGAYYEYSLSGLPLSGLPEDMHLFVLKDPPAPKKPRIRRNVMFPPSGVEVDTEGVALLANGKPIILSEGMHTLFCTCGCRILTYPKEHPYEEEEDQRGLEGITTRPGENGSTKVAVIFEGGYVKNATTAKPPVIVTHTLTSDGKSSPFQKIPLNLNQIHKLIDTLYPGRKEPGALRFRAPDLLWDKDNFIVLLSPIGYPDLGREFGPKYLQRFNMKGEPVGDPYALQEALNKLKLSKEEQLALSEIKSRGKDIKFNDKDLNWEGLGWWSEKDRKLMLVNDAENHDAVVVLIDYPGIWEEKPVP